MTRKEANTEIIRLLVDYINENPDQRFGQILRNTDAVVEYRDVSGNFWLNEFFVESEEILQRMTKEMNK